MNTDRNLDDAMFVIKEFGLDYTQIQATGIPEKYGVHGFPTMIIIDQKGNIQDLHAGYSPDLRERIGKKIDDLLKKEDK